MTAMDATNDGLIDATQTTIDDQQQLRETEETTMQTARNTGVVTTQHQRAHVRSVASGQWWKVWVLLSSLGATMFGWLALTSDKPTSDSVVVAPPVAIPITAPGTAARVLRTDAVDKMRQHPPSARPLPTMPQRPVFQSPVTRTRRS